MQWIVLIQSVNQLSQTLVSMGCVEGGIKGVVSIVCVNRVCLSFLVGLHRKRIGGERTIRHHQHVLRASIRNDAVAFVVQLFAHVIRVNFVLYHRRTMAQGGPCSLLALLHQTAQLVLIEVTATDGMICIVRMS